MQTVVKKISIKNGKEERDLFLAEMISTLESKDLEYWSFFIEDLVTQGQIKTKYEQANALAVASCFAWFSFKPELAKDLINKAKSVTKLNSDRDKFILLIDMCLELNSSSEEFKEVFVEVYEDKKLENKRS
jgi:hypothetical protein